MIIKDNNQVGNGSLGASSEGSTTNISAGILGRIFSRTNSIFGGGKLTFIILILQLTSTVIGIYGIIGLRTYFTGHGEMLLKMRNVMQEVYTTDRQIRQIFSSVGKCGSLQAGFNTPPVADPPYPSHLSNTLTWMAGNTNVDVSLASTWVTELGMENDFKWFRSQIERSLYRMERSLRKIKTYLFDEMNEESINWIYETKVNGFYFDKFDSDIFTEQKRHFFNFFDIYNYFILNVRYMLEHDNYNLKAAPYVALDLNLNSPEVIDSLVAALEDHFVVYKVNQFAENRKMAQSIILYTAISIFIIMILLVPLFIRVRRVIKRTYSVLQELYNFELRF